MSLLDMNMNMNMNMNMGFAESVSAGRLVRPRFNTDVAPRSVDASGDLVPPEATPTATNKYPPYPENWDAELRASMYLDTFLDYVVKKYTATPYNSAWRQEYAAVATSNNRKPPDTMTRAELNNEISDMLDLALEREPRFAEILDQDDSVGSISYWLGMLKIDPARTPATYLIVRVARRVGEHVAMCLKGDFMSPRPSQLSPAITPMIDPPITPSFPAGHAVQAYLISFLLADAMRNLPQHKIPDESGSGSTEADWLDSSKTAGVLFDLAARVSQNRIVAGLHFPVDIEAGRAVAARTFMDLRSRSNMQTLKTKVMNDEFPQYKK
jgi:hypothetical protein